MEIKKLFIIPDKDNMERSIELAREYNCGFVYGDFIQPSLFHTKEEIRERIRFYRRRYIPDDAAVQGVIGDIAPVSDEPDIRRASDARIEQSLYVTRLIDAGAVVFRTNYVPNFHAESYRRGWVEKNAQYLAVKLSHYEDINIYIENMFDMNSEMLVRLGEALKGTRNFGVCLNYAHAHIFGKEEALESWVKNLAPYVKQVHISDSDGEANLRLPIGDGQIDWEQFKQLYEAYLQQAAVLINHTDNGKIEESLRKLTAL